MRVIFISGALDKENLERYDRRYAKGKTRFVQQWWDYSFACALYRQLGCNLKVISFPPVATFPQSECLLFNRTVIREKTGMEITLLGAVNVVGIKQNMLVEAIKRELKRILRETRDEETVILTHTIYYQSAKAAFWAREKYGVKVYTIVPDLPHHMMGVLKTKNSIGKRMFRYYLGKTVALAKDFDGYICFAEPQMAYLNAAKPYIVMEGFMDTRILDAAMKAEAKTKRIIYAGGLMYRYGIRELVEGFQKAKLDGVELHLYGKGEAEEYIVNRESQRVFFGGCISREEMIREEKGGWLLVNPRPTDEEYSKCSFPSKLMEYMATGTPVLTSHLGCIPSTYDDKLTYIDSIDADSIAQALKYCLAHEEELLQKAERAKVFIREEKNVDVQAERVLAFLEGKDA